MEFTFGIITDGSNDNFLNTIIDSIERQNIPDEKYEVIIVGNSNVQSRKNTRVINFNESIKQSWITKKKNIITSESKFENIVFLHDYIQLLDGWYSGFIQYGNDFLACMNIILNADNTRFRDWTVFPPYQNVQATGVRRYLLPYTVTNLSNYQYFSGAYFVCKKKIMMEIPLNERLSWGEGEDVEWSSIYKSKYKFSINALSSVKLLKYKPRIFDEMTPSDVQRFT